MELALVAITTEATPTTSDAAMAAQGATPAASLDALDGLGTTAARFRLERSMMSLLRVRTNPPVSSLCLTYERISSAPIPCRSV